MKFDRVYVETFVKFFSDGGMRPLEIKWIDGTSYVIDRVKYVERAPAKTGSLVTRRFTVLIDGQERYLYYDEGRERWFVEKRIR
jgi:hypothetical protein